MKRLLANLLLGGFGLLLAAGLAEAALHLLPVPDFRVLAAFQAPPAEAWIQPGWEDPPVDAYRRQRVPAPVGDAQDFIVVHKPNENRVVPFREHGDGTYRFKTNNLGLRRDADTRAEKRPGALRVLVLGDSHTMGFVDNDESFTQLLEGSLNARLGPSGRSVEVLNGGVVGYAVGQEYLWYVTNGAPLKPDLVVVVFYVGNDLVDLLNPAKPGVNPATDRAVRARKESDAPADDPLGQFRLFQLGRYAIQSGPLAEPWRRLGLPGRLTEAGGYPVDTLVQVFRLCPGCWDQSVQQAARARRDPRAMEEAIERAGETFGLFDRTVRADGGRLAVALLPTRAQVEPALADPPRRQVAALLGLSADDLAYDDRAQAAVLDQLAARRIPAIRLVEPLRAATSQGQLYYNYDWHLNALGHRVEAAALEQRLTELALLP